MRVCRRAYHLRCRRSAALVVSVECRGHRRCRFMYDAAQPAGETIKGESAQAGVVAALRPIQRSVKRTVVAHSGNAAVAFKLVVVDGQNVGKE